MTDTEAMLWDLERDPQLASTIGAIALLDGTPDLERLRNTVAGAVLRVPALHERVVPSPLPLTPPDWEIDVSFDLDHHLRVVRLPHRAGAGALDDVAGRLINDPFDRSRPLWHITVVTGLPGGRSALVTKLHHSITDGAGAVQLALELFDLADDGPIRPAVDVAAGLDSLASAAAPGPTPSLTDLIRQGAERVAGLLTEASSNEAATTAKTLTQQLPQGEAEGSPLWRGRSRNRRVVTYPLPLESLRRRSRQLGVSINDVYVAACAEAAIRHHDRRGVVPDTLRATVVISTRAAGDSRAHNAAIPTVVEIPAHGTGPDDRLAAIRAAIRDRRDQIDETPDLLATLGTVSAVMPRALTSAFALEQTQKVDFATSNLPGPPTRVWIAGTEIRSIRPVGPVGGTAFNATLLSYADEAAIGLHVDPRCIPDPAEFRDDLRAGLAALAVPGLPRPRSRRDR